MRARARALVVDDDPVLCELIATTLSDEGYETRQASRGGDALRSAETWLPDVVVLDVHLPDMSGYHVCHDLRRAFRDLVAILFISGTRTESLDRAAGLLIGADDYLVKPFVMDELLARVAHLLQRRGETRPRPSQLTSRELEVLRLLSAGLDHVEIAGQLVVSPKTVEKHIEHILGKLGVHSRAQAVAVALGEDGSRELVRFTRSPSFALRD